MIFDSSQGGDTVRPINRIDHVAAAVMPDQLEAAVARMSTVLNTAFYGPVTHHDATRRTPAQGRRSRFTVASA